MKKKKRSTFGQVLYGFLKFMFTTEPKKPMKKSRFQERNLKKETPSGDNATNNLKLHKDWIDITEEKPVYYAPIDIHTGKKIYENWARVSDGEIDYYINNRDNHVILKVKYWRKRKGIIYPKYDPMTSKHIPIITENDMYELLISMTDEYLDQEQIQYNLGVSHSIDHVKDFIKDKIGNLK